MSKYLGDFLEDATVYFSFTTNAADGGRESFSATLEEADIVIFKDGSAMTLDASTITITSEPGSRTGVHIVSVDMSNDADFSTGSDYIAILYPSDETLDSQAPAGVLAQWSCENRTVDVGKISGDSTAADNLEAAYDGTGYDVGGIDVSELNTAVDAIGSDGTGLTEAGGTGDQLTAIPWNSSWDAEVQSECNDALVALGLDHLLSTSVTGTDVADDSIIAQLVDDAGTADWDNYDNTANSLQALRVRGDAAWTTGGGGSISDILDVYPLIPTSIDLADTATVRLGLQLRNAVDDLPSTGEITPGTISIDRKSIGGTSWSSVVSDAACSESAGLIYYDEVFDSGTGYAEGDSIRITFKSQKITVSANDYEITGSGGVIWQTEIRQTMRGTDSAYTGTPPTAVAIRTEMDSNSTQLAAIVADTNELQGDWADGGRLDLILDARSSQSSVDTIDSNVDAILVDTGTTLPAAIPSVSDIWTTALTESYGTDGSELTGAQLAYLILGNVSEFAISSTTKTVKQLNGSSTAATYTLDDADNPTSVTRTT